MNKSLKLPVIAVCAVLALGIGCSLTSCSSSVEDYAKLNNKQLQDLCAKDDGMACYHLGLKQFNEKAYEPASVSYQKACDLDNGNGCFALGMMWKKSNPFGRKSIEERANALFKKACDLKNGEGCFWLAEGYKEDKKNNEAKEYYKKACDQGYKQGCDAKIEENK